MAVVTKGFSPLGLDVGYFLKKDFAITYFDKFDLDKRNQVIEDKMNYCYINTEEETDLNQTLQGVMVCFANVRLLVNIIEPKDIIDNSAFKVLHSSTIRDKVSQYVEGVVSIIRVIALQMACQTEKDGFKGQIINIINCGSDSDSRLLSSMISASICSMTAPLAKLLQPYRVRVNSIVIDPKAEAVAEKSGHPQIIASSSDVLSTVQSIIEDTNTNSMNIRLRGATARL